MAAASDGREGQKKRVGRNPTGPGGEVRRYRVTVMLTEEQHQKLDAMAKAKNEPLGTVAYEIVSRALKRVR